MKRILFSFLLLLSVAWASAQTDINAVFVSMPDSLLPLLTRNDRLDLLDYHKAGMEARVTNLMGGTTTLLERNDTTICLQLTRFRAGALPSLQIPLARSATALPKPSSCQKSGSVRNGTTPRASRINMTLAKRSPSPLH